MVVKILLVSVILLLASLASARNVSLGNRSDGKLVYQKKFEKPSKPSVTAIGIGSVNIKDGVITAIDVQDLQGNGRSIILSGGIGQNKLKIALFGERGTGYQFIIEIYGKVENNLTSLISSKDRTEIPDEPPNNESENPDDPSKDKSLDPLKLVFTPDESEDQDKSPKDKTPDALKLVITPDKSEDQDKSPKDKTPDALKLVITPDKSEDQDKSPKDKTLNALKLVFTPDKA